MPATPVGHAPPDHIIVGVDTHKYAHVAVAITQLGARVASCEVSADHASGRLKGDLEVTWFQKSVILRNLLGQIYLGLGQRDGYSVGAPCDNH